MLLHYLVKLENTKMLPNFYVQRDFLIRLTNVYCEILCNLAQKYRNNNFI